MSGKKKKVIKKKKTSAKSAVKAEAKEDLKSVKSNNSTDTVKTAKTAKSLDKKKVKKKIAPSVSSLPAKSGKKGKISKGKSLAKTDLNSIKSTEKKLPPNDSSKSIQIPILPNHEYKHFPVAKSNQLDISKIISGAPENSSITIPAGTYFVQCVINKPLKIVGQGEVQLISPGNDHTLTIRSNSVYLKGLHIYQKFSNVHSSILTESGSVFIEECFVYSEMTPGIISTGDSVTFVNQSKVVSPKAPPIFGLESTQIITELSYISDTANSGVVLCGKASAFMADTVISGIKRSGIVCKDSSKLQIINTMLSDIGQTAIEIGSKGQRSIVKNCVITKCGCNGISIYGDTSVSVVTCHINNCASSAVDCSGTCGVSLRQNKFEKCGAPCILLIADNSSVESTNDTFLASQTSAVGVLGSSELTITDAKISEVNRGFVVNDESSITMTNCKITDTTKSILSSAGKATIHISDSSFEKIGDNGLILDGTASFEMINTTLKNVKNSAILATGTCELTVNKCKFINCDTGAACNKSPLSAENCETSGSSIVAYEFHGCKGSLKECKIEKNKAGIICHDKASASLEHCTIESSHVAIQADHKSAVTIRNSTMNENGVIANEKSVVKIRTATFTKCPVALELKGGTTGDVEGMKCNECKAGIVIDSGKLSLSSSEFESCELSIEARNGATVSSSSDSVGHGKGQASIVLLGKVEATIKKAKISKPGDIGIFAEGCANLTLDRISVSRADSAGVVSTDVKSFIVTEGKYEKNGRAGIIVSGEGKQEIKDAKGKENGEATVLIGGNASPNIQNVSGDDKVSAPLG